MFRRDRFRCKRLTCRGEIELDKRTDETVQKYCPDCGRKYMFRFRNGSVDEWKVIG